MEPQVFPEHKTQDYTNRDIITLKELFILLSLSRKETVAENMYQYISHDEKNFLKEKRTFMLDENQESTDFNLVDKKTKDVWHYDVNSVQATYEVEYVCLFRLEIPLSQEEAKLIDMFCEAENSKDEA